VGFVNVLWDGLVHAWLQDTMVAAKARGGGIGTHVVTRARDGAKMRIPACGFRRPPAPVLFRRLRFRAYERRAAAIRLTNC
jgi:GNAT superfamily N-acetyltransferase